MQLKILFLAGQWNAAICSYYRGLLDCNNGSRLVQKYLTHFPFMPYYNSIVQTNNDDEIVDCSIAV